MSTGTWNNPTWRRLTRQLTQNKWLDKALCAQVDPELFFPAKGDSYTAREARIICLRCPVQKQCLEYALRHNEQFGVWGGMTERERRRVKKAA
jgi:WhiB family redox-sensing transcriptional regulator